MGTGRITQGLLVQRVLTNLSRQTRSILELQEELATGLRVNEPSDDPLDARRAISARASLARSEQYIVNIRAATPFLSETTTSIQTVLSSLQRVRELTLQGASGTNNQNQLDSIATEINQILEGVVGAANHETNGRHIFGGTRTASPPFVETRDAAGDIVSVAYEGNLENINISVSETIDATINENGADAFMNGQDVFQLLIDIRDDLRAGDQTSLQNVRLGELQTAEDKLAIALGNVGAIQNRLERVEENTQDFAILDEENLANAIEADFSETIVSLNAESNAFQAALNAAARVIQPSLLDFVR